MFTNILVVVECLDKYDVECCDEGVLACFDEGVVALIYKNNNNGFTDIFILSYPLEYLLEENFGGQCLVHHGYMNKLVWYENYVHFCHCHNYKNLMIYQDHPNYWR